METKLPYYKSLDGLRGIAALSVLIFHFFISPELTKNLDNINLFRSITEFGQHGVTLFFVLSGFVITRILLNKKGSNTYFREFYKNRALRIFPLYYLYLIIFFYVFPFFVTGEPNLEFGKQIPVYLYIQNLGWLTGLTSIGPGHYWSLAVEEHFYLIWPLIVWLVPYRNLKVLIYILIVAAIPLKYFFVKNNIDINYNTFARFDQILHGSLIALIEREKKFKKIKFNYWILVLGIGILLLGSLTYVFQNQLSVLKDIFKYNILSIFFFIVIYWIALVQKDSIVNKYLESSTLQYLGKISYGIYVWHMMAIAVTILIGIDFTFLNFIISLFLTICMAHISFFYFEIWFLKFKSAK